MPTNLHDRDEYRGPPWFFGVIGPATSHALAGVRVSLGVVPAASGTAARWYPHCPCRP